ncbi:TetR/AcrR family transcriptional regulator [Bacillus canaveralius]|uniref:TetR/AcrR family transcriptional regulator n=1 Tax=Bacillus canaveralius TaxID=1403243 RepID=A0A2N5GI92_9BACI|nr:TetR/AcrR family transcriptional regulator [Bacillus canaveralius]PLR80581.1 TetR/AcrR family transcriptional regulator [Bacillus canaveralius]PLR92529.1 TetR/AcrR family transcriptional regulator [Bacillus canaveralius]
MSKNSANIDRRIKKTKAALKVSIITLMQRKDFEDISITDIVQLADLNRGTFYKHYQYKEELLEEVIDDVITDLIASYREPYQNSETFEVRNLTSSAIKIFEHVANYSSFYTLIVQSNTLSGFQNRICNELRNLALQDLEDCQPNSKINRELRGSYQAYAVFGMIIEWINDGFKYSSNYMAEQLLEIIKNNPANHIYKTTRI